MHIPDGYLSPQTFIPLYGVFIAVAAIAVKKVKKEISVRNIPYIGMAAAFTFIIMMFNIPIPGGTSGHAVGSAVIAIILGPWTAVLAISVALIIQALIFGDGGITAIGANCFNMAVFMPFIAYYVFKFISNISKKRTNLFLSSFLSGYISMVMGAVITAIEFGIQPLIASNADGKALYCPYPLKIALPVMAVEHLLLIGIIEGIITFLIIKYFYKNEPNLIYALKKGGHNEAQ